MAVTRHFVIVALLGLTSASIAAQVQYSTTTELVVLNVRVTDDDGAHVPNLSQRDFAVYEDGKPQEVTVFADADAPVTVGLIIDSSISMWAIRDRLVAGATAFARASHPENEVFAIAFNDARWPALPPSAPFTNNAETFRRALTRVVQPRGKTALYDAINAGLDYAARGTHSRKALVVLSDGGDNASKTTLDDVIRKTQASNVVIHGVALVDPLDRAAKPEILRQLARATGGETFRPATVTDVQEALERVAKDIRSTYLVGYSPSNSTPDAYHTLRVEVLAKDRGDLRVRTREGYRQAPRPVEEGHVTP
jgi:Ca-activated chloride channel family protein